MNDMTVDEFRIALRAGLGRCVLFLDGCENKEPYHEAVLLACLNDYAYDGQSEGTRAWYTYRLLSYFNDDDFFFSRIAAKLRGVLLNESNVWWFEHLFDLVLEFARRGHAEAKELIVEIYNELLSRLAVKAPKPYEVDYDLQWLEHICIQGVQAGGESAYVSIAADLGKLFTKTEEYDADSFFQFIFLADDMVGRNALDVAPDPDGNIAVFLRSVAQNYKPSVPTEKERKKMAKARAKRIKRERKPNVKKILRDMRRYDNTDPDGDWHTVVLDIVNNEDSVFPIEAYMYVYTGLCACCRKRVVDAMHKHGLLTEELLRECEFDCYDETRELAKSIMNSTGMRN